MQRLEPLRTPAPETGGHTTSLPETLLSQQIERLAVCAAVGAGLWTYGAVMDGIVRPLTASTLVPTANVVIEVVAVLVSAMLYAFVRWTPDARNCTKVNAGVLYVVLNAVGVALINTWAGVGPVGANSRLSWNTAVILIAAMILPATPRKMLVTALVAAATDPIAVWFAWLRGAPVPSLVDVVILYLPNFACAVVAVVPSHVLHRLGRRLRRAEEMGSYHLVELLGRGGMGEVWRARHRLLARSAAIKLVRPELLGASSEMVAANMLRRFEKEAQATAALSSPHTIRLFDFGVTADHTFYYVMELLSGRDLESLVREFGPMPAERAVFLLKQICHSLADAHARGLVHRDVTPSNIYVCRMGLDYDFVKVLDFGLVTSTDRRAMQDGLLTGANTTTGTPAFMAPETIVGGESDQRVDIYAIGCVAYYLLTGQPVFEAETPLKMFVQHVDAAPIPPSQRTELPIPRQLDELVMACLAKDPRQRPVDASALLDLLGALKCREPWTNDRARTWWEHHLLELTGPLTLTDSVPVGQVRLGGALDTQRTTASPLVQAAIAGFSSE